MSMFPLQPVAAALALALVWIGLGVTGLVLRRAPRLVSGMVFPAGALVSLALAATGWWAIGAPASALVLPAGIPDLPFHVRADALSGFFLLLLGGVSFGVSLFASGYFRDTPPLVLGRLTLQYHVFLADHGVDAARGRRLFVHGGVGDRWRCRPISSSPPNHEDGKPQGGFLYLLIAHIGAIAILLAFGVMQGGHGDYTFDALRAADLDAALGHGRVPARVFRFRRQGRHAAVARVAAGSPSRRRRRRSPR